MARGTCLGYRCLLFWCGGYARLALPGAPWRSLALILTPLTLHTRLSTSTAAAVQLDKAEAPRIESLEEGLKTGASLIRVVRAVVWVRAKDRCLCALRRVAAHNASA